MEIRVQTEERHTVVSTCVGGTVTNEWRYDSAIHALHTIRTFIGNQKAVFDGTAETDAALHLCIERARAELEDAVGAVLA